MNNIRLSFLLLACILASACGQKGDLYLPNIPPAPNVLGELMTGPAMPQSTAEPLEEEKSKEDQDSLIHETDDAQSK